MKDLVREAMQVLHESQLAEADHLAFTEFLRDLFAVKKLGNWMEEADEAENEMVSDALLTVILRSAHISSCLGTTSSLTHSLTQPNPNLIIIPTLTLTLLLGVGGEPGN